MQYVLFHKDTPVANLEFSNAGIFEHVNGYYKKELMPPGTRNCTDEVIQQKFTSWLEARFIPQSRPNRTRVLNLANCIKVEQLITKSYGLSINDCYWFKPLEIAKTQPFWDDVNLYNHASNAFVPNILLFNRIDVANKNFFSPDLTTPGLKEKGWFIENGRYMLYKCGSSDIDYLDAANEVISSVLCQILGARTPNYELGKFNDGRFFTKCECFCSQDYEFIPFSALSVEPGHIGKNGVLNFIKENNLQDDLNKLLVHDFLLNVINRDFTNIGYIRNSQTFKAVALAPIFGSGYCLWADYKQHPIGTLDEARTFDSSHAHQIKLVTDFSFIDFDKLDLLPTQILSIYKAFGLDAKVANEIVLNVNKRINKLKSIINGDNNSEEKEETAFEQRGRFSVSGSSQGGFGF